MAKMLTNPSIEEEEGRDDFLFLSAIPWISFTSFTHAMHYSPVDSVPRIVGGKYFKDGEKMMMPLSVQAHHAIVDGKHTGQYFQLFQKYMTSPMLFIQKKVVKVKYFPLLSATYISFWLLKKLSLHPLTH